MTSFSMFDRLAVCAGGVVALAAGLFCSVAPPSQLAIASRVLLVAAGIGAFVVLVAICALLRRTQLGPDKGDGGDQDDCPGPLDPADPFDLELRELLKQEGALQ